MKIYNPSVRLNNRTMWFGLTVYDMSAAFGVFALVSNLLPQRLQYLAFITVPLVLVPVASIREFTRDGYFADHFYFLVTPKLIKNNKPKRLK